MASYSAEFDADMRRRSESVVCLNLTAANRKRSVRRSFRSQCWPAHGNVDNTSPQGARRTRASGVKAASSGISLQHTQQLVAVGSFAFMVAPSID